MSLWLDFLGVEVRYVQTPSFGRIRIAEAGKGNKDVILFQHGMNGHLEAYAKNVMPLSDRFHVIAFDYVGHGLSDKKNDDYSPAIFADQVAELMDALEIEAAHLSGESLGGWVSGLFAAKHPHRVRRLMLNTAAGIPVVSEKGKQDLMTFKGLNKRNVDSAPTRESVTARMQWLMHPSNHHLLQEELIDLRLRIYLAPETRRVAPQINAIMQRHDDFLIPLEQLQCETLFLWTRDNPIHDLEAAQSAAARVPRSSIHIMEGNAAHWPQYEAPDEFNAVASRFFAGEGAGAA